MRSVRRKLSLLLVMAMVLVSCLNPQMTARAETGGSGQIGTLIGEAVDGENGEPEKDGTGSLNDEMNSVPEATGSNAIDPSQIPAVTSLLPLKEVEATLGLNGYSAEELTAIPLETILALLRDEQGKPFDFGEAKIVWAYTKDENGERTYDKLYVCGRGDTVDISRAADLSNYADTFEMELIVGNGMQLDASAIRYIVTVYLSEDGPRDNVSFYLYSNGERLYNRDSGLLRTAYANSTILSEQGIPVTAVIMQTMEKAEEYSLRMSSTLRDSLSNSYSAERYRDMSVDVYRMSDFLKKYSNGKVEDLDENGKITDQIFSNSGYKSTFAMADTAEEALSSDNLFCITYTDKISGEVLAYQGIYVVVESLSEMAKGQFLRNTDGKMEEAAAYDTYSPYYSGYGYAWYVESSAGSNGIRMESNSANEIYGHMVDYCYLNSDTYSQDGYYFVLNGDVKADKIVAGNYDSPEEAAAAGAEDITEQILAADKTAVPYGYNVKYNAEYTVFYANGIAARYCAYLQSDVLSESLSVSLKKSSNLYVNDYRAFAVNSDILEERGISVKTVTYYDRNYSAGDTYSLTLTSYIASNESRHKVNADVYLMKDFLQYYKDGAVEGLDKSKAITDTVMGTGYSGKFAVPAAGEDVTSADNFFCIVYTDPESGDILGYIGYLFILAEGANDPLAGNLYENIDGKMSKASSSSSVSRNNMDSGWGLDFRREGNKAYVYTGDQIPYLRQSHTLNIDHHVDSEYYFGFDACQGISKVVLGQYNSLEAAQGAVDITSQIMISDPEASVYGYKANFSQEEDRWFTIFTTYGAVLQYTFNVYDGGTSGEGGSAKFTSLPLVHEVDRWFVVNGAKGMNGSVYAVENDTYKTLDTLYGYGYQTIFLMDTDADMTKIMPTFRTSSGVRVRHTGEAEDTDLKSGEFADDFSNGPVLYTIIVNDATQQRNYVVDFVQKQTGGPKLYVNHPDQHLEDDKGNTRELFLTEYFENQHDILIANIGDEELTGLTVTLENAEHVKLDDYWTVGGDGNDTLAAFTTTNDHSSRYGTLPNLAKVRLVPDGEGDIKGKLTISADGQEPVVINLTGIAANPKILTASMSNAVKYVPYSQVVSTSNMYEFNKVTFSITDGELPEGVTLGAKSGEIYGVPKESGEFTFTVRADFSYEMFLPDEREFTLTVADNTNENVYLASDAGYTLQETIGTDVGGYDFELTDLSDQLFVSEGVYGDFEHKVYLNGEELTEGVDYTSESGSTRITIKSQTFSNKAKRDGTANTIAAEFRKNSGSTGGETGNVGVDKPVKEMKRAAQNFKIPAGTSGGSTSGGSGSGSSSSNSSDSSSASAAVPDSNWTQDAHGWRHQLADGSWAINCWQKLTYNGVTNWYYFGADGYMMTGWFTDADGRRYYLNPSSDGTQGAMAVGWRFIDGEWYYFNTAAEGTEGSLTDSGWRYLEYNNTKDWYYFDSRRVMVSGWIMADGRRYYLNPVSDGFKGRMLTGWQQVDGHWYYFNEQSDGTRGAMMTDTTIGEYHVGHDGVREQ